MEVIEIITAIFVGLLGILIYLVIKYPDRCIGTRPRTDLDGPKGYPLIGNLLEIHDKGLVKFMIETLIKYGPNATFSLPGLGRVITINNPECIEQILKTNFENYNKSPIVHSIVYDVLGDGIFNANGHSWKMQRKLSSHLFNGRKFREIICVVFKEETEIVLKTLDKFARTRETFDLQDLFFRFTMDSFGKITLGLDFNCLNNSKDPVKFATSFDFAQRVMNNRIENPFWKFTELFTEEGRKMREVCDYLSTFAYDIIKKHRNNPEASKDHGDILNIFMNAQHDNGEKLTDKELRDIILNFIIAGRDTTAQALSWMMYNLMADHSIEEKLVKEVSSLLTPENPISNYDNIKLFQYTQAVFYETLRLHPVVPKNVKVCLKDDVLPNGIPIYAGDIVSWSSWAMGRDERTWGNDARQFNPERFLNSEDGLKPSQYKFNSFNAGPRLCLGQSFATVEAIMLATAVLRQFKFEMVPGQKCPPDYARSVTLPMKDPLLVKVKVATEIINQTYRNRKTAENHL
ncbi:19479_t:CDS:10 [Funneliformis geosporum]|uniref:19479_t:CDS:1 n=1 Tax=Funneliformis geosporum TaxID=1117311 RepID=A0A9W4SNT0_9GLOM|nr:19479_t:CDS:10 [Funneliformis geosporum]